MDGDHQSPAGSPTMSSSRKGREMKEDRGGRKTNGQSHSEIYRFLDTCLIKSIHVQMFL